MVSHRCQEFEQPHLGHGGLVGCRINANWDSKPLRTVLSTKILIGSSIKLLPSTNLTLGGTTLTVRRISEGDGAVVVATAIKVKFGSRLIRTVCGRAELSCYTRTHGSQVDNWVFGVFDSLLNINLEKA